MNKYDESIGNVNDKLSYHILNRALLIAYAYTDYGRRTKNFDRDVNIFLARMPEAPRGQKLSLAKVADIYGVSPSRCRLIVHRIIRFAKAYYKERGITLVTRSPTEL